MAFDMGPVAKRIEQRHRNRSKHPRPYRHPSRKSSRDRKETNFYHNSTSFFDTEAREKKQSPQKKTEEESNKKKSPKINSWDTKCLIYDQDDINESIANQISRKSIRSEPKKVGKCRMRRIAKSEAREKKRLNKFLESDDEYENLDLSELAEGANNPSLLSPEGELKEQLEQGMNELECERSLVRKDAKDEARCALKQELDERKMPSASINGNGSIIGNGNTINNFFNVTAPVPSYYQTQPSHYSAPVDMFQPPALTTHSQPLSLTMHPHMFPRSSNYAASSQELLSLDQEIAQYKSTCRTSHDLNWMEQFEEAARFCNANGVLGLRRGYNSVNERLAVWFGRQKRDINTLDEAKRRLLRRIGVGV
jgi:hypothetical protein